MLQVEIILGLNTYVDGLVKGDMSDEFKALNAPKILVWYAIE